MLTSLIGAPPGYVGYEDEGVLSKHILAYPSSILVLKEFNQASGNIQAFIMNFIKTGFFTDQQSRMISLNHVIVIVEGIEEKINIGFQQKHAEKDHTFDEIITNQELTSLSLNSIYEKALSRLQYEVSFDFDIDAENKKKVNQYLYEFTKHNKKGTYQIHKEDILDTWL